MVKYSVRFEESDASVLACDLEGFFVGRYSDDDFGAFLEAENARVTFRLVRPTLGAPIETLSGDIEVIVLDTEGRPMGRYPLWGAKLVAGDTPEYLVVTAQTGLPPHAEARRLWDRFRVSPPRRGEWCTLQVGSREAWLEVAGLRYAESASKEECSVPPREIVMGGDEIKDVASFFCAIGEAFRGPGGYMGQSFTELEESLEDYLQGAPVRLIWRNIPVARSSLSALMDIADGPTSKFDLLLGILSQNNVDVVPG
ncbi:barstar family protein [Streptomyces sp. NRRL S-378]|uniref:barstar family protein n=1 Tax=Streptomyces sp. NRRL S-378 TaxID=1463904 RepID=UPI00131BAFE5|nr:barstar family protein [Streptomyces sp. NRRL S-378]